jgi:hypothetical protein
LVGEFFGFSGLCVERKQQERCRGAAVHHRGP